MRDMVPPVPGVYRQGRVERNTAKLGMHEGPREIRRAQVLEVRHPADVERVEQIEGHTNRRGLGLGEFRP